jgi:glutaredoxin
MNKIILYSTGCVRCNKLKEKLNAAAIQYEINTNEETMESLGFEFLPVLEVNGKFLEYGDAVKWIKETKNEN